MKIDSVMALQECMEFVGIAGDDFIPHEFHVVMNVLSGGNGSGTVTVWLQNQPHRGPKLLADDTMYGFGIRFGSFEPEYQRFGFEISDGIGRLTVTNSRAPKYSFVLGFSGTQQE